MQESLPLMQSLARAKLFNEFRANVCALRANSRNNSYVFARVLAKSRKTASICTRNTAKTAVSLQRWHGKIYLYLWEERQPVLAKSYRAQSRAFSSISRQTAYTRTVGISREIVRLAAFLREDTRSRGFARDSRTRVLSRANAMNNFCREGPPCLQYDDPTPITSSGP